MDLVLRVEEYAFATPSDLGGVTGFARFCRVADVAAETDGWGLLLCTDAAGRPVTLATSDVDYVRLLVLAHEQGLAADLPLPLEKFAWRRPGWPDTWIA